MVPFGYPKYLGPYYNRDPKRDHDFDNHPYGDYGDTIDSNGVRVLGFRVYQ